MQMVFVPVQKCAATTNYLKFSFTINELLLLFTGARRVSSYKFKNHRMKSQISLTVHSGTDANCFCVSEQKCCRGDCQLLMKWHCTDKAVI